MSDYDDCLIRVDIPTGAILVNNLDQHWIVAPKSQALAAAPLPESQAVKVAQTARAARAARVRSFTRRQIRRKNNWTSTEINKLLRLVVDDGQTITKAARQLDRTSSACQSMMIKLKRKRVIL